MSGGGDDPFQTYSQLDPWFGSSLYPPQPPPFSPPREYDTGSRPPPDATQGFDLNNSFGTSSAAAPQGVFGGPAHAYAGSSVAVPRYTGTGSSAAAPFGGLDGPAHGYSGYGVPLPYYPVPYQAGGQTMPEPARHSTTSLQGFEGRPPLFRPYGEGSSHAGHAHLSHGPPSWRPANMDGEMSSAAPPR
ncbi:unnamed protein product [Urochloa humidicola]